MDETDISLLDALQTDARRSYAELGAMVGLSVSGVNARLKKLTANGYVRDFGAQLDPARLGLDLCAFIQVVLDGPDHDAPFLEAIRASRAILECHHVTGDYSYLLKVRVRGTAALEELITGHLKRLPGVTRTHTVIALSTAKETGRLDVRGALRDQRTS